MSLNLHQLLKAMLDNGASDLHITVGTPPQLRVDGLMHPLRTDPLTATDTKQLCYSVLSDKQKVQFEEDSELDFSFGIKNLGRFRANVFLQGRGMVAGAFRIIPFKIVPLAELGLPPIVDELCCRPRGLVLVTGPTGSGKSTTLASMIDKINTDERCHIVTIEDPVEFLHTHKNSVVNQREIGSDTMSFKRALKSILRQDPDVVLVGELRDLETIEAALTLAETGHLTFATLHTNGAIQTINRIVDVFPPHQQPQIRAQLSFVLEGVLSQTLLPRIGGTGRVLCAEVLVPNAAIRNLIREDKVHQIYSQMQIGQSKFGMQTFNQSLVTLVMKRQVSIQDASARSPDPDELKTMLNNAQAAGDSVRAAKPTAPRGT
ncbi:MAG: type IV pilus twitching motility protein PilT [Myxococcales bacterium]|nr:type IV pilus twitching motility protein PilT [Myxococcales bacterium]